MTDLTSREQAAVSAEIDRRKFFATAYRETDEAAYKDYALMIASGEPEEYVRRQLKDRYQIGTKRLNRILESRAGHFHPTTAAEIEAKIVVGLGKFSTAVDDAVEYIEDQLEKFESLPDDDRVSIKYIERVGGKDGGSLTTESLPVRDAKTRLHDKIVEYRRSYIDSHKALRADVIINMGANKWEQLSDEDLTRQIAEHEKRRIKPDYSVEGDRA